jgi:hypothetical protein
VPSALSNDGTNHHDQRLRNILDAQSDVLDTLNAMTKVHIDKTDECMEILYDLYTDPMMFSHRGKILAPSSHSKYHIATTWSLKTSKRSSTANIQRHNESIRKSLLSTAHIATYL